MKRLASFLIIFILISTSEISAQTDHPASIEGPLTLLDCYSLALKQSEIIAIDAQLIKETEARFLQALGVLLPQVSFSSTQGWKDTASSLSPKYTSEQMFVFKQTLFSGFKEFAGMKGSQHEHSQRVKEKVRAEQLLFIDVSESFYLLAQEREDLKTLQEIKEALRQRVIELRQRERLGRSRRSEVVNTEVQYYGVNAEIELTKAREAVARQILEFLTARPINVIIDSDNPSLGLESEQDYTSKAMLRPDVQATMEAWEVAKNQIAVAKSNFFPTINLENDYYTYRNTFPTNNRWNTLLTVDIPLFEGTLTFGQVREANTKARESELQFIRTRRSAVSDIRSAYVQLKMALSRKEAIRKALRAAQVNYYLQKEDYKLNLVSNLDVLESLRQLGEARINYSQSLYETKRLYWQLIVAVGEPLPKEMP